MLEFLPTSDVTNWNTDKSAALVVTVDGTVLFDGRPSIKITIPAGASGGLQVGTNLANALIPYGWTKEDLGIAIKYVGFTGYDWASTFPPSLAMYLGDSGMLNFWTVSTGVNLIPEAKPQAGEWAILKPAPADFTTGGGTPAIAPQMRTKLRWTQVSQVTDSYIYIGFVGKLAPRKKATLVMTLDDGYASWYSFVWPLMKHYKIPASMGLQKTFAGQANFMTEAQIKELWADKSNLIDYVTHGYRNISYGAIGAEAYYAETVTNRDWIYSLGVYGDGPLHHPYVQTVYGNDLISLMKAGGFLTARTGGSSAYCYGRDGAIKSDDEKQKWAIRSKTQLTSSVTLANAIAAIDAAIANKDLCFIMGHDFASTAGTDIWAYSDFAQLMGYIASKVDAGTLECKSWSRWYADLTGRQCDRK